MKVSKVAAPSHKPICFIYSANFELGRLIETLYCCILISSRNLSKTQIEDYPNYSILYTGRELWL